MVLTTISPRPLSSRSSSFSLSLTLCLHSLKPRETSTFHTGAQSPLTSTSTYSISVPASTVNSQELTTCLTLTHLTVPTPSAHWLLTFLNTSMDFTTMTTLETSVHQTLRETTTMFSSKLSQDSLSLVNGKLTGIRDTICQPNSICSKM